MLPFIVTVFDEKCLQKASMGLIYKKKFLFMIESCDSPSKEAILNNSSIKNHFWFD